MTSKRAKLPSFQEVSKILTYEPDTGKLRWTSNCNHPAVPGNEAGTTIQRPHNYRLVTIGYKLYKAHRICWLLATGKDPGSLEVIHVNGNGSDNRWSNLRAVTTNTRRLSKQREGAGVSWDSRAGKWRARLRMFGKSHSLGLYESKEAAAQCVEQARKEMLKQLEKRGDET